MTSYIGFGAGETYPFDPNHGIVNETTNVANETGSELNGK